MKADFFILADRAQRGEQGKLDIFGAGISFVDGEQLPIMAQRLVAVSRLLVDESDAHAGATDLAVRWTHPDKTTDQSPPFDVPEEDIRKLATGDQDAKGILFVVEMNGFVFGQEGRFVLDLLVNGEAVATRDVTVRVKPAAEDLDTHE